MKNSRDSVVAYLFPTRHADLIWQFAAREVKARYRQSWLGTSWVVITPLMMVLVFTFVFQFVFKARWPDQDSADGLGFALRLYAGLAVFNFFSECLSRAPRLVLDQPHLVKKVVFPIEILPWVNTLAAMVQLLVGCVLLLALNWLDSGSLPVSAISLPLVWLPLVPLCVGLGWLCASIGTYVRDLSQIIAPLLSFLMFLSPIFYPLQALPAAIRPWAMLNPLALPISLTRDVLISGLWPHWVAWSLHLLGCLLVAALGAAFFQLVRRGFADVV